MWFHFPSTTKPKQILKIGRKHTCPPPIQSRLFRDRSKRVSQTHPPPLSAPCGAEAWRCLQWNNLCLTLEPFCLGEISDVSSPTDEVFRDGKAREFGPWSPGLEIATLNRGILPSKYLWQEKPLQLVPTRGLLFSTAVCICVTGGDAALPLTPKPRTQSFTEG